MKALSIFCLLLIVAIFWNVGASGVDTEVENDPEALISIRDPFKSPPPRVSVATALKSELQQVPVEKFKYIGALAGHNRLKAMILAPSGKTFYVTENMKIGVREGIIKKITTDSILVREKTINFLGREETFNSEIRMPPEGKIQRISVSQTPTKEISQ